MRLPATLGWSRPLSAAQLSSWETIYSASLRPVSAHDGPEFSYSKNGVSPSEFLWFDRWNDILTLGSHFLEIITWTDYGELHYLGQPDSTHFDHENSKWTKDM